MKIKKEQYIPFITSCKIFNHDFDQPQWGGWMCQFSIDKDEKEYQIQIFIDEKTQRWVYTELRFKKDNKYLIDERRYTLWNDHLFHQLVTIVKKNSKDRLRLINNVDMSYANDIFETYDYKIPDKITINEEKTP